MHPDNLFALARLRRQDDLDAAARRRLIRQAGRPERRRAVRWRGALCSVRVLCARLLGGARGRLRRAAAGVPAQPGAAGGA
jgi:hypothetical protein